jgi:Flp pilus assembly protein TadD
VLQFELGRACLLLGDSKAAATALEQALQIGLAPKVDIQARRFLRLAAVPGLWAGTQRIESAIAAGDLHQALAHGRMLVREVGPVAEAWFLVGIVNHKLERPRRAERALRRAVRRDANFADAHNWLGIMLVGRGKVEEGRQHLERAHELSPSDVSPLLHLAQACALLGRREQAEQHVLAAERLGADARLVQAVRREFLAQQG